MKKMKANHILIAIAVICCILFVIAASRSSTSNTNTSSKSTTAATEPRNVNHRYLQAQQVVTITLEPAAAPPSPPPETTTTGPEEPESHEKTFEEIEQHANEQARAHTRQIKHDDRQQQQNNNNNNAPGSGIIDHVVMFPVWSRDEWLQELKEQQAAAEAAARKREEHDAEINSQQPTATTTSGNSTASNSTSAAASAADHKLSWRRKRIRREGTFGGRSFRVVSDGTVALIPAGDTRLSAMTTDAQLLGEVLDCAAQPGYYWKRQPPGESSAAATAAGGGGISKDVSLLRNGACTALERWRLKLLPFEVSSGELSCVCDTQQVLWITHAFAVARSQSAETEKNILKRFEFISSQDANNAEKDQLHVRYSRFMFWTSWLFDKWLPWGPAPQPKLVSSSPLRMFHNKDVENIFQLENFCIDPFGGLSGVEYSSDPNAIETFEGKQDDRGRFSGHSDLLKRYFAQRRKKFVSPGSSSSSSSSSHVFFDQRPVLFIPLDAATRNNIGHVTHRALSAIGLLRMLGPQQQQQQQQHLPPPLLVFVFEQYPDPTAQRKEKRLTAWAFFYRLLWADANDEKSSLPYAVVTADSSYSANSLSRLMKLRRHVGAFSLNESSSSSSSPDPIICFARGYAAQSCYKEACNAAPDSAAVPSYSFDNWISLTRRRKTVMEMLQVRQQKCAGLPRLSSSSSSHTSSVPHIFFDIRTQHRKIRHFGLMIEDLRDALGDTAQLTFAEPYSSGSRAQYLRQLSTADIVVGVHGGTLTQSAWQARDGVLVELSESYFWCKAGDRKVVWKNCWFDLFSDFSGADHFLFKLPASSVAARNRALLASNVAADSTVNSFPVPVESLVAVLQQAICRWNLKKGRQCGKSGARWVDKLPKGPEREVIDGGIMPDAGKGSGIPAIKAAFSPGGLNNFVAGRLSMELKELKKAFIAARNGEDGAEKFFLATDNEDLWQPLVSFFVHPDAVVVPFSKASPACVQAAARGAVFGPLRTEKCFPVVCFTNEVPAGLLSSEEEEQRQQQQQQQQAAMDADGRRRRVKDTTERGKTSNCLFRFIEK